MYYVEPMSTDYTPSIIASFNAPVMVNSVLLDTLSGGTPTYIPLSSQPLMEHCGVQWHVIEFNSAVGQSSGRLERVLPRFSDTFVCGIDKF